MLPHLKSSTSPAPMLAMPMPCNANAPTNDATRGFLDNPPGGGGGGGAGKRRPQKVRDKKEVSRLASKKGLDAPNLQLARRGKNKKYLT